VKLGAALVQSRKAWRMVAVEVAAIGARFRYRYIARSYGKLKARDLERRASRGLAPLGSPRAGFHNGIWVSSVTLTRSILLNDRGCSRATVLIVALLPCPTPCRGGSRKSTRVAA